MLHVADLHARRGVRRGGVPGAWGVPCALGKRYALARRPGCFPLVGGERERASERELESESWREGGRACGERGRGRERERESERARGEREGERDRARERERAKVEYPEPGAYLVLSGRATLSLDGKVLVKRERASVSVCV